MKIIRALAVLTIIGWSHAVIADLLPQAKSVKAAYEEFMVTPSAESSQLAYLKAFPSTYSEFMATFSPRDFKQLYDGHEYIMPLEEIGKKFPERTLAKLLPIEAPARWEADAVNYLQHVTLSIAGDNPEIFVRCLRKLPLAEQKGVVKFLVDGIEGPHPEAIYLIGGVEGLGERSLAKQMRREATLSQRQADDEHGR